MRLSIVGVFHETNSFAPGLTELENFRSEWVEGSPAFYERYTGTRTSMGGMIDAARAEGAELSCGVYLYATPSGMVSAAAAAAILARLESAADASADGVLVILHGAMAAEGIPDMEAEALRRIRGKLGPTTPIAITLDLHANISQEMLNPIQIVTGYDTYPHIDPYERAVEATVLLARTIRGEIRPVHALARPGLLIAPPAMLTDEAGPMRELIELAHELEQERGVLSIMLAGGFPYCDVPAAGMAVVVTTDGDADQAKRLSETLSQAAWERRERFLCEALAPDEALRLALEVPAGPVVLVEASDNVGGGAPGDATFLLERLVGLPAKSLIVICDREAVRAAHALGIGGSFNEAVGGKSDRRHGDPVRVQGQVKLLGDGKYIHIGPYMTGQRADMGLTAVVEAGGLTLLLTELRTPPWDLGHVASLGLVPEDYRLIVVKAAVAWKTAFGDLCSRSILVDTPGCCATNVTHFHYEQVTRPIYPLDV